MNSKLILYYLQGIWRRKWIVVAVCWVVCIAGWIGVFRLEDVYESRARVYVDVDSLLTPLLRGISIDSNPFQQLDYLQRTLLSRPNLEQVLHLADMDSQAKTQEAKDALIKELAGDIGVSLQGNNLFSIVYQDNNPLQTKNVVQAVLTVFSETSAGMNRNEMDNARRFLEEQIASYEKQLRAAEARRAQFRQQYGDVLPQEQGNRQRLDAVGGELQKLQFQLQDAQGRRDGIAKSLAATPATLSLDQAAAVIINNGASNSVQAQISDARRKLTDLQSRYTDDFPDVVALKRDIASLEKRAQEPASAKDNDEAAPADKSRHNTVSNPVYEQLKLRLADAESVVSSVERQITATQEDKKRLELAVNAAPGIELQAENLDRDYGVLKKNFDELVSRRESANISQAANTQADKVQFRIIDPPQVPLKPIGPKRRMLYSGVLLAGLGAGVAAAFLLIQLDRSFASVASLRELGFPVLGTISRVILVDMRRRTLREIGGFAASVCTLLMIYGVLVSNLTSFYRMV